MGIEKRGSSAKVIAEILYRHNNNIELDKINRLLGMYLQFQGTFNQDLN